MGGLGNKRQRRRMDQKTVSYEIGYGKPPVAHRFVPGRSGNPRGRPKGAVRNPSERLTQVWGSAIDELLRLVPVRQGDDISRIPVICAIVRALAIKAATGDLRATSLAANLLLDLLKIGLTLPSSEVWDGEIKVSWVADGARPEVMNGEE